MLNISQVILVRTDSNWAPLSGLISILVQLNVGDENEAVTPIIC